MQRLTFNTVIRLQNGRRIGDGATCFVIAEAGSNHNGDLKQAKRLIQIAAEAGADAVKFQVFRANRTYAKNAGQAKYLKVSKSINKIIEEMEMPYDWLPVYRTNAGSVAWRSWRRHLMRRH